MAYAGDTSVIKIGYDCFFTKMGKWVYRADDALAIQIEDMAPSQKQKLSNAFAFIAKIHNAIGKNIIDEQQSLEPSIEQSREFGREFARTCKKLNAMSVAIGQGFNEEMEQLEES